MSRRSIFGCSVSVRIVKVGAPELRRSSMSSEPQTISRFQKKKFAYGVRMVPEYFYQGLKHPSLICVYSSANFFLNTMQYGPTQIYRCPSCGTEKHLMSLLSGNTFNAVVWSDSYRDYPHMPAPSRVQRCPSCGRYFFLDGLKPEPLLDKEWEDFGMGTMETGTLDYPQSFESLCQLEGEDLTEDQLQWLHFNLLYAFNDWRTREQFVVRNHLKDLNDNYSSWALEWRENAERQLADCLAREVKDSDDAIFRSNAEWLMEHNTDNRLLCAELHRELGEFEKCLYILDEAGDDSLTRQFRAKAKACDREVFRLHFGDEVN